MNNSFDEFVKSQTKDDDELNLTQERLIWIENLSKLYSSIQENYLKTYIADGSIRFERVDVTLNEEMLGDYIVQEASIYIGNHVVKLKPIGTFLIGARGRVDMIGPRGSAVFLIVPPNSQGMQLKVTANVTGQENPVPPEKWIWKIAPPPPNNKYIELTENSFRDVLMGVVSG